MEKIFLAGISWGSVLGLSAAARHPEKFYAYVGWEQIANWVQSDELAYRWALDRAEETGNRKATEQLTEIGPPPWRTFEQWSMLRLWLLLFGGFYRSEGASAWWRRLLSLPGGLLDDIAGVDLFASAPRVEVPVYFFHGVHDQAVSLPIARRYVESLEAPRGKHLALLKDSAHISSPEDARKVEMFLIETLPSLANTARP